MRPLAAHSGRKGWPTCVDVQLTETYKLLNLNGRRFGARIDANGIRRHREVAILRSISIVRMYGMKDNVKERIMAYIKRQKKASWEWDVFRGETACAVGKRDLRQ